MPVPKGSPREMFLSGIHKNIDSRQKRAGMTVFFNFTKITNTLFPEIYEPTH